MIGSSPSRADRSLCKAGIFGQGRLRLALLVMIVWISGLYMGSNTRLLFHEDTVMFFSNVTTRLASYVPTSQRRSDPSPLTIEMKKSQKVATAKPKVDKSAAKPEGKPKVDKPAAKPEAKTKVDKPAAKLTAAPAGAPPNSSKHCTFPEVDPFDKSIEYTLKRLKPLDCGPGIPNLVRVENETIIVDHEKVAKTLGKGKKFLHCKYHVLRRKADNDKVAEVALTRGSFNVSMKVNSTDEEIRVDCLDETKAVISKSWFAYVRVDPARQKALDDVYRSYVENNGPAETLSILVLGLDGFAKQHFARTMPKSREFLIKEMGALEMHKHGKLGYSTFPNVMGLLTGRTIGEFLSDKKYKWNNRGWMDPINDAFVWSDAKRRGYRTGMIMDQVSITAFHFLKLGYREKPVDHYLRRIVIDSEKDPLMRKTKKHCYGDEAEVSKMYDYWFQLLRHYNSTESSKTPFFAYSFLARLTHDDYNGAFMGDELYLKFLRGLKDGNTLNNTVIIWFSDHGERFGKIRSTYQGTIESSTPYLFFIFPPWFEKKYPDVMRVFRINQNRLTSHYDTYATMQDLLNFKGVVGPKGKLGERSISLFREIPEERTCADAQIPAEYCVCARFSKPKLSPALDNYLGMVLRDKVSFLTKPQRLKCVDPRLHSVESILEETETGKTAKKGFRVFRVRITTEPGSAMFEATLQFDVKKNSARVVGEVARTNMYRGQADCMSTVQMRRYCYCKNLLKG